MQGLITFEYFYKRLVAMVTLMNCAGCDYLFSILLLEHNQFFGLLIHLILQSVFLSIQGRDRLLKNSHFLFVLGAVLTQLSCQTEQKSSEQPSSHRRRHNTTRYSPSLSSSFSICS